MRLPLVSAALALVVVALPATALADIVWRGDFETNDLSQWNEQTGPVGERVTIVADPVREGMYAARVEIRPGDLGNGMLNRVEFGYHPPAEGFEGSERWYAWSAMQDADAPIGASWHVFTYWEAEVLYTPAITFRLYAGNELRFCTYAGGETVHWTTTFEPGMWHDFVFHVVWSPDPTVGLVELYYDGELVLPAVSTATMFTLGDGSGTPNFIHQGMIRDETLGVNEVFYYDGMVEATALEDVMPSGDDTSGGSATSGVDTSGGEASESLTDASASGSDSATASGSASATSSASGATTTAGSASGGSGDETTGASGAPQDEGDGGCGCSQRGGAGWAGLGLLLLATRRASRRRRG